MEHLAHTRTGGKRRQKGGDLFFGGCVCLAEVERDKPAQRGGLTSIGPGFYGFQEAGGGELPKRVARALLQNGDDAQELPKFSEGTRHGGISDLAADIRHDICNGESTFFGQQFIDAQPEGRDFNGAGGFRRALPSLVAPQGEDEGKRLRGDEKVRQIAWAAQ